VTLGEKVPFEQKRRRRVPLKNRYFAALTVYR